MDIIKVVVVYLTQSIMLLLLLSSIAASLLKEISLLSLEIQVYTEIPHGTLMDFSAMTFNIFVNEDDILPGRLHYDVHLFVSEFVELVVGVYSGQPNVKTTFRFRCCRLFL